MLYVVFTLSGEIVQNVEFELLIELMMEESNGGILNVNRASCIQGFNFIEVNRNRDVSICYSVV